MRNWDEIWRPVDTSDERVRRGMETLSARRREELQGKATHIGWKVGWNDPKARAGLGVTSGVVGFLTSTTVTQTAAVSVGPMTNPVLEVELALRIAQDDRGRLSVTGAAPAFEIL